MEFHQQADRESFDQGEEGAEINQPHEKSPEFEACGKSRFPVTIIISSTQGGSLVVVNPPTPEPVVAPKPPKRPRVPKVKTPQVGISFWDIRSSQCRWIVQEIRQAGSDIVRFCGQGTEPGESYCPEHSKVIYKPQYSRSEAQQEAARIKGLILARGRAAARYRRDQGNGSA